MHIARTILFALVLSASLPAFAQALKNKDFVKLSAEQRRLWFMGAYTTLGHVASLDSEEKGKCVWNWYFDAPERKEALLEKSFAMYPDQTPSGVVLALLRRDCGAFPKGTS